MATNRKLVMFYKLNPNATKDAHGHVDESDESNWLEVGKRWVEFKSRGSREFIRAKQQDANISHLMQTRADSLTKTFDAKHWLKFEGRVIHLTAAYEIDESERKTEMVGVEKT